MSMYCVCVVTHTCTHSIQVGHLGLTPGVGTGHLKSPEEINMYCIGNIHVHCTCAYSTCVPISSGICCGHVQRL